MRLSICKEFPYDNVKKHHSSLAGMCLDFTVPVKCASLVISGLGFWVTKASLEEVHGSCYSNVTLAGHHRVSSLFILSAQWAAQGIWRAGL